MATTGPITSPLVNGFDYRYGLQLGPQGAQLTGFKVFDFTVATSTNLTSTAVTAKTQTISGLTTNDIVLGVQPTTGPWQNGFAGARVSASSQLEMSWAGLSTSNPTPQTAQLATLFIFSYANQSSSTTT